MEESWKPMANQAKLMTAPVNIEESWKPMANQAKLMTAPVKHGRKLETYG